MDAPGQNQLLTTDHQNGVLKITLAGGRAHALSRAMIGALHATLDTAAEAPNVRTLMIHGPGPIFCAGHDMKEIAHHRRDPDHGRAYLQDLLTACSAMMLRLARFPKPTVAVCEGIATAGGLQLLTSCDVAFAAPGSRFSLPGVVNGGFCTTPAVAVARRLAPAHLNDMVLSGAQFDADWAQSTGLISRVVPGDQLLATAQDYAETLAQRHQPAILAGKAMLATQTALPLAEAYAAATPTMLDHFMDPHRIRKDLANWS